MLAALVLAPIVAAVVVFALPSARQRWILPVGTALSLVPLGLAIALFCRFDATEAGYQFVERAVWFDGWGISWYLGVDGISLGMLMLTTILVPVSLVASVRIEHRLKEFVGYVLLLEAGVLGVFLAVDLFAFFVFFEVILIPMYFIIGIWGSERRIYAALKFFLYTAFGSALMLAAIIALGLIHQDQMGRLSFALDDLMRLNFEPGQERWLFAAFALAFAIKVPLFPLHTWLPDAHVEAPTAGSVLLAGVLLKLGTYGLIRFCLGLFPQASVDAMPVMATLAVVGIVYGAVVAIVQPDLKKLVAYSSVSHLGFIVLGTFALSAASLQGAIIQNVNHGLTTGALFLLVGMIYERRHTKKIADFGGLAKPMPLFAGFFLFMAFASIGLPALNGFVGEFLILVGSYPSLPVWTIGAATGVILAAIYMLWAYERVFTGEPKKAANKKLDDLNRREVGLLVPLALLVILLGLYPKILLDKSSASVDLLLDRIEAATDFEVPRPVSLTEVITGGGH